MRYGAYYNFFSSAKDSNERTAFRDIDRDFDVKNKLSKRILWELGIKSN